MAKKQKSKPVSKPRPVTRPKVRPEQTDIFAEQRGFWRTYWKEALVLVIATCALYLKTMPYEFVLDDQIVITDNKFTKKGVDGIADIFTHDSFTGYFGEQKDLVAGSRYRPLSLALFAVIHEFFGLNQHVYHLTNVILYALLSLLIFRVLALLLHANLARSRWFIAAPFIGALLYVLHPIHTEAVANIKGCDEILAMLGAMAALYAVMRFACHRSWIWLVLSGVWFFAGLLAKENTITFLAVIPMTLYFFTVTRPTKWLLALVPALVASAAYIWIRYSVIGYLLGDALPQDVMNNPFLGMTDAQQSATIVLTLGLYLKLLFFPHPLTHDYYPYHIPIMEWSDPVVILSLIGYCLLIGLGLYGLFRRRVFGYAILYYLATLSIVSNIVFPIGTFMNERFLFMPSFALAVIAGHYGSQGLQSTVKWQRLTAVVLLVAGALGFALKSWLRVPVWENATTLNTAGVSVSQNSARANCFMGTALYQEALKIKHPGEHLAMIRKAEIYIDKSISILPEYLSANQMKSGVIAEYYRYDRDLDKLLAGFAEILSRKPGVEYVAQYCEYLNKQDADLEKLIDFYYHAGYEILELQQRRHDYALKYLNYGYQLDPNNAKINYGMGKAYIGWGDQQRSQGHLERAYRLDPSLRNQ